MADIITDESARIGPHINPAKTVLLANPGKAFQGITILDQEIPISESFTYLGKDVSFTKRRAYVAQVKERAWKAYHKVKKFRSTNQKVFLYDSLISSAMLYGSQSWNLTEGSLNQLEITERKILRRIFNNLNFKADDGLISVPNEVLYEMVNVKPLREKILNRKLKYFYNVLKQEDRWVQKLLNKVTFLKRPIGCPQIDTWTVFSTIWKEKGKDGHVLKE
uniref:Reverse transcriptase domain-containing protein n=1 Tax=Parastrongyloides trichosuri TaxID=131310 RepID=A0A0N4ZXX6_PARTI